jgi:hypothetical protein
MRFLANLGKLALLILLLLVITGLVVRQTGNRSPNLDGQAKEVIVDGQQPAPVDSATYVTPDPTAAPSQEMEERPSPDFWPRQVRLAEPWVFEQKNNYGTVTASRPSGEVVRVVNVKSEKLEVESNGLSGAVETHKTDFWGRAKEAQRVAIEKAQQDKILEERRQSALLEEQARIERQVRYQNAPVLHLEILQVLDDGVLAKAWSAEDRPVRTIFVGSNCDGLIDEQKIDVKAVPPGVYRYQTVLGSRATIERWSAIQSTE